VHEFVTGTLLSLGWLTEPGQPRWNPDCDISIPADDFVDMPDFAVFARDWLAAGVK